MIHTMKTESDGNVKKIDNVNLNSELVTREEIEDTPFTIIGIKEQKIYFGTLGEYRVTEKYKNKEAVEQEVKKITWNRVIQVMMILIEKTK